MNASPHFLMATQFGLALAYALLVLTISDRLEGSDFISLYTGGAIVRDGQGARLYDLDLQSVYQAKELGLETSDSRFGLFPFINPPHAALVFAPFAFLSPEVAALSFLVINCLIAAGVLRRLWSLASLWTLREQLLLIATILATEVFWYGLGVGTMTILMFACILEYYLALKAGRDTTAGIWLIAATVKPQLILFIALIPLAQRRWRFVSTAVSLGMIVGLGVSVTFGFHIWGAYFQLLRQVGTDGEAFGAFPLLMNNLRMILSWIAPSEWVLPSVYFTLVAGLLIVFILWRFPFDFDISFACTLLLGLFLAPHLNYQDTLLAFLPAVLLYNYARNQSPMLLPAFKMLVLAATFVPAGLIVIRHGRPLGRIWPVPLILILLLACAHSLWQETRSVRGISGS